MHLFRNKAKPADPDSVPDYPLFVTDRPALATVMAAQRCTTTACPEEGFELVVEYPKAPTDVYPGPLFDAGCKLLRSIQERPLLRAVVSGRPTFEQTWTSNGRFRAALLAQEDPQNYGKWALRKSFNYVIPSLFIPCVARTFYDEFARILGRTGLRVLDPSSGWGDRLAGAYCSGVVREYVGTDPNSDLFSGYAEIQRLMRGVNSAGSEGSSSGGSPMSATLVMQGFETVAPLLPAGYFDVVFTSPPFFDYEVYSPNNPTYVDWNSQFYQPLVEHSMRLAKADGIVAFHIDDTTAGRVPEVIRSKAIAKFAVDVGFGKRKIAVWLLRRGEQLAEAPSPSEDRKRPRSPTQQL
jgi:hypothetical protein